MIGQVWKRTKKLHVQSQRIRVRRLRPNEWFWFRREIASRNPTRACSHDWLTSKAYRVVRRSAIAFPCIAAIPRRGPARKCGAAQRAGIPHRNHDEAAAISPAGLMQRLAQAHAVRFVARHQAARAGLRQPAIADCALKRAALAVNRPRSLALYGKMTEFAATETARIAQARPARRRPIEHLDLEVMGMPRGLTDRLGQYFLPCGRPLRVACERGESRR